MPATPRRPGPRWETLVRELVYFVATSIDGYIATAGGDYTPLLMKGDSLTALIERYPEILPAQAREALGIDAPNETFDTVLMGARTYQVPGARPSPYPHLRQVVVSRSVVDVPADVTVVAGDVVQRVRELKQERGASIWLCGGGTLAAQLLPEIDRLMLKVTPVVLGHGLPLFHGEVGRTAFEPRSDERFANGMTLHEYVRVP
jgi:dihydrofolate reductase